MFMPREISISLCFGCSNRSTLPSKLRLCISLNLMLPVHNLANKNDAKNYKKNMTETLEHGYASENT